MDYLGQQSSVDGNDADRIPRERGLDIMENNDRSGGSSGSDTLYSGRTVDGSRRTGNDSYSSNLPLTTGAASTGALTSGSSTSRLYPTDHSGSSIRLDEFPSPSLQRSSYQDSPYLHSSRSYHDPVQQATIDPYNIADDGDDGFMPEPQRRSVLTLARQSSRDALSGVTAGAVGAGGEIMRSLSTLVGRRRRRESSRSSSSSNDGPVVQPGDSSVGSPSSGEKSEWLTRQTKGSNKMKWILFGVIGGIIILAIIGGVIGGVVASKSNPTTGNTNNTDNNTFVDGDLDRDSAEIKALMNNTDLHRVFPAIDYTPWGTQYPLCLTYPPSQDNVTRDMAVLSQLTNQVRLYGTDCNQTQMVLTAIDKLQLTEMQIWLGVWIETNDTTNTRQMAQMYDILETTRNHSIFSGVIIGNEALYRAGLDKASSEIDLISRLTSVRSNFTSKGYDIPIATSDLGDNWNTQLVAAVDIVMSNIHPFFAGVPASQAASWTWEFWHTHDIGLTSKKQIISETGWPSTGGNDCGSDTIPCPNSTTGSIAGINQMNIYLQDWVCQALNNGTEYFWFVSLFSLPLPLPNILLLLSFQARYTNNN